MSDGEQVLKAKFQVGEQVIVYLPADTWKRRPPFGTVEKATWYRDRDGAPVTYAVYTVRMEDGEFPNPIEATEFHIEAYGELALQNWPQRDVAAQEAAEQ